MLFDTDYLFLFKTDSRLHNALSDNSNFGKGVGKAEDQNHVNLTSPEHQ